MKYGNRLIGLVVAILFQFSMNGIIKTYFNVELEFFTAWFLYIPVYFLMYSAGLVIDYIIKMEKKIE